MFGILKKKMFLSHFFLLIFICMCLYESGVRASECLQRWDIVFPEAGVTGDCKPHKLQSSKDQAVFFTTELSICFTSHFFNC